MNSSPICTIVVDEHRFPKGVKLNGVEIPEVASAIIQHLPGEPPCLILRIWVSDVKYETGPK